MTLPSDPSFLVFGASGQIGGPCAQWLAQRRPAAKIRVVTSRPSAADDLARMHPQAEVMVADYLNADDMVAAFAGIDAAFIVTPDFLDEETAMNNVVAAVESSGTLVRLIRQICDTPGVHDESKVLAEQLGLDHQNGTIVQHLRARKVLSGAGLPITYMNPLAWYFENFSTLLLAPIRTERLFLMPGDRLANFMAARDIGRCAAELLADPSLTEAGETVQLENGVDDLIMFSKVAEIMSEVWGVPIAYDGSDEAFLGKIGPVLRKFSKRDGVAEYVLALCHREVAMVDGLTKQGGNLRGGDRYFTPEMLGFEPLTLRTWLRDMRSLFIPESAT
jgi:uncharacterized protein YbjT (DUF2867 family)